MDRFPRFFKEEEEWKSLEIKPKQFEDIVSRLLSEFNLDLQELEKIEEGDTIAIAINKLGEETKSLVRTRSYTIGLEMEDVEDLYEDMLRNKAISAIFITSSHFTKEAKEFAKHVPIKLVDGVELGKLLSEYGVPTTELAFLSGFTDKKVLGYFKRQRAKKFLGLFGSRETIEEIDRMYIPMGQFSMKKTTRDLETSSYLYVDLTSGSVFHMEENRIEEDDFIKRILDLPEESRVHLLDLIKHGELEHEHLKGKALDILEKERLIGIRGKNEGGGVLNILMNEITSTMNIFIGGLTSISSKETSAKEREITTTKYVRARIDKPVIDASFDIGHFIESSTEINPEFDPDPVNYSPEDVVDVLKRIYKGNDVSFVKMAYLPYYRCKYIIDTGRERFKKLFTPKFKQFVPKPTAYTWIYRTIDRFPAIPYLIIALGYLLLDLGKLKKIHVLSSAFIFLSIAVIMGVLLKVIFKTERKIPRYGGTIVKYGFPSIHALASIGAIAFVYFVDPMFALLLAPLGLLYMYSRIKLGVHSERDILGGAITGLIIGIFCGIYILLGIYLEPDIETVLGVLFFVALLTLTTIELRTR